MRDGRRCGRRNTAGPGLTARDLRSPRVPSRAHRGSEKMTAMDAWVDRAPRTGRRRTAATRSSGRFPSPPRARSASGSAAAASAAPTCTWPRATCRRAGPRSPPDTRSSAGSTRSGPDAEPVRRRRPGRRGLARRHRRQLPVLPPRRRRTSACTRRFTGWDVDGGYADACLVDEAYAYRLPDGLDDEQAAPLLCAGIIGYRALVCAAVPPGGRLGIYGFGGSAHLTAQVALAQGLRVHVLTRGEHNQQLARELGVDSVGAPPTPAGAAGRRDPVRPRRRAGAGRAARPRPRRHPRRRRHLAVRHPGAGLRRDPVPRAPAAQRHGEHPARRREVPRRWPSGSASGPPPSPTR